jgi:glycosyltransferase involved in cell wall biosynthesis
MNRKQRRAADKTRQRAAGPLKPGENVAIHAAIDARHGRTTGVKADGKTIGLCMIVKNEAHVILRCLESARPLVDYVLIEDTGSTDGTQAIIREWLDRVGMPGEVYDEPWRDFAYNRSHALARLRENKGIDYALIIDADDQLVIEAGFDVAVFKETLSQDLYYAPLRHGLVHYQVQRLCSNKLEFRYRGVIHEFIEGPQNISSGTAAGFYILSGREGARSQDPDKYHKDAALLEKALQTEKDKFLRSRYTFYLARSYRDAGEKEKALDNYLKRAPLGHWTEEIFDSLYNAAELLKAMGRPFDEVIAMYLRASDAVTSRAEALHAASRLCRENNKFADGYKYARRGLKIPLPAGGLFVQSWVYDYGLLDELAINAYWTERYAECVDACDRLLSEGKLPVEMRDRVLKNKNFAVSKQQEIAGRSSPEFEPFLKLLRAARQKEELARPDDEVISAYMEASAACPTRAEALHGAARFCRNKGLHERGYEFAAQGLAIAYPKDAPALEDWIYEYGLLDELAVNAYWTTRYPECVDACDRLLSEGKLPTEKRDRVLKNKQFAIDKLAEGHKPKEVGASDAQNGRLQSADSTLFDNNKVTADKVIPTVNPTPTFAGQSSVYPRVLLAILAKQAAKTLPFYLSCIDALDYPKKSIVLYIRTNNNTDRTVGILKEWVERVRDQYAEVEFDSSDVPESVQQFGIHEWNATRFKVLAKIRYESLQRTLQKECDYYFVVDTDNFIRPCTLRSLVSVGLPIVAPLLRSCDDRHPNYSNFHEKIDERGYFLRNDAYFSMLNQRVKGLCEVSVVHCTYLVRSDVIPRLRYDDESNRHEYVVFAESARKSGTPQYLDTRDVYGYLTLGDDAGEAMKLIGPEIGAKVLLIQRSDNPRIFGCFGLHSSGSTWMFNLVREICRTQGVDFVSLHRDSEANLPWDVLGVRLIVVKTHNPFTSFQSFIASSDEPAVITVRDPRDAVVSFMQRFSGSSFDEALKAIALSAQALVALSRLRKIPVFRYEDGFVGSVETFERIAALLGTSPSEDDRIAILAGLTSEAIRKTISGLEAAGTIQGEAVWDKETHWHAKHVGDGKIGKFKGILSPTQQREIVKQTREFCDYFDYDQTIDTNPEHSNAFAT